MLHFNEYQLKMLNQMHRQELHRQVVQERLAQAAQSNSPAVLARLGGVLVSLGVRLQETASPETPALQQTTNP